MLLTYYYSACVGISTPDLTILSDPWFTDGIYDGAWYKYPPIRDPIKILGQYDYIYISHIHQDHYDPIFLRAYLAAYPDTKILIGNFLAPNILANRMRADGIEHQVIDEIEIGATRIRIFVNGRKAEDAAYDSAMVVKYDSCSILNMNDNMLDARQVAAIKQFAGDIRIALLPYVWATNLPQSFIDPDDPRLETIRGDRIRLSLSLYLTYLRDFAPALAVPFAGKFLLGGRNVPLNGMRAVIDAIEVLRVHPQAVVLDDYGKGTIDSDSLLVQGRREAPYNPQAVAAYAASLARRPFTYDRLSLDVPDFRRALERLLRKAHAGIAASPPEGDAPNAICLRSDDSWFVLTFGEKGGVSRHDTVDAIAPRFEVDIDPRYLFGLLTGLFHWNNAELGCHFSVRARPGATPIGPVVRYLPRLRVW